jgi:hypothetical protein
VAIWRTAWTKDSRFARAESFGKNLDEADARIPRSGAPQMKTVL